MSFTTPIYIPLVEGLDLSKDSLLKDAGLQIAENIDWSVQGEARGRPSRSTAAAFVMRDPAGTVAAPSYLAPDTFLDLTAGGLVANGLMRLRDASGERAMLGTNSRLFAKEDTYWQDRGAFSCFRVDKPHTYYTYTPTSVLRPVTGPDFGSSGAGVDNVMSLLDTETGSFQQYANLSATPTFAGNQARCGTVTASVYYVVGTTALRMVIRNNAATTVSDVLLASDCFGDIAGSAPCISCDEDQTVFFVAYETTGGGGQYKVLRVNTSGTVLATFTGADVGLRTHWVCNSTVAVNKVIVATVNATTLTLKVLTASTMVDAALDSTYAVPDPKECVVGYESSTRAWWAVRANDNSGGAFAAAGLSIGTVNPASAASATLVRTYKSTSMLACPAYTPMHQPVKYRGRMYMTIAEYTHPDAISPGIGTWFTLDLSNVKTGSTNGPFEFPTLAARGVLDGSAFRHTSYDTSQQPESAVLLADGTGWAFVSTDWVTFRQSQFANLAGSQAAAVQNKISPSKPRCALAGGVTMFSGSVPRILSGDQCYEMGFPSGKPRIAVNPQVGGGNITTPGSYTISVCWSYTDASGQVHRSSVSSATASVANATDYFDVYIQAPYWSERPTGQVQLEVYSTEANPTATSIAKLQVSVGSDFTLGYYKYQLGKTSAVKTNTQFLYTNRGELAHVTPSADGGISVLGRRVWVADKSTAYASLLLLPNSGATWNDEGALSVAVPAGAGRILALEGMDDKLVIFCERGVYAVQDGGPANNGQGPDLAYPVRLSDLGCAGPRSTCLTDRGVVFCSPLDSTDPQRGGPWLLDRSLSLTERKYLGAPAMSYFFGNVSWVPEVAFSPERQQVYVSVPVAGLPASVLYGDGGGSIGGTVGTVGGITIGVPGPEASGVVVIDLRSGKWSTWAHSVNTGDLETMDVVSGVLWTKGLEVAPYSGLPGEDEDDGEYTMSIATGNLFADGRDGLGWARCRSISVLGSDSSWIHDLTILAIQDQTRVLTSGTIPLPGIATSTSASTWPLARQAPEWRLPSQKCSTLKVHLTASPATARWAAIRLDVQPLPNRAPTSNRS